MHSAYYQKIILIAFVKYFKMSYNNYDYCNNTYGMFLIKYVPKKS